MNNSAIKSKITNIAIILLIAIFFIVDRYLKALALGQPAGATTNLVGHFFSFQFTPNRYLAFSLPLGGWLVTALILLIIGLLIYYIFYLILNKNNQKWNICLLTIILFGAISNVLDRLSFGYVIDYLYLKHFTVFNLADALISVSAAYLLFQIFTSKQKRMLTEIAANLGFVFEALKNLNLNGGRRVAPSKDNAVEMLVLHDLKELVESAKKESSFDKNLLKKILEKEYQEKMRAGKSSVFYNFRKVLEKPEYVEHLRAMLNDGNFEISSN